MYIMSISYFLITKCVLCSEDASEFILFVHFPKALEPYIRVKPYKVTGSFVWIAACSSKEYRRKHVVYI